MTAGHYDKQPSELNTNKTKRKKIGRRIFDNKEERGRSDKQGDTQERDESDKRIKISRGRGCPQRIVNSPRTRHRRGLARRCTRKTRASPTGLDPLMNKAATLYKSGSFRVRVLRAGSHVVGWREGRRSEGRRKGGRERSREIDSDRPSNRQTETEKR